MQEVVVYEREEKEKLAESLEFKDKTLREVQRKETTASEQIKTITIDVTKMKEKLLIQTKVLNEEKDLRR